MSNLLVRILTGVIAGAAVVAAIWASPWGLWAFCVLISLVGLFEFYKIAGVKALPVKLVFLIAGMAGWGISGWILYQENDRAIFTHISFISTLLFYAGLLALATALGMIVLLFQKSVPDPLREISISVFGWMYAIVPFALLFVAGALSLPDNDLAAGSDKSYLHAGMRYGPLGILFLHWTLDSMAYFGGKYFGRHKLFERISPKKTWEGAIIGTVCCMALGTGLHFWWPMKYFDWIVIAGMVSVLAQLGDLAESMFKRSLNLKDSGGILPGHGGILDRFDGLLVSMPFTFGYIAVESL